MKFGLTLQTPCMFAKVCTRKCDGKTFCLKIKTEAFFLFFTVIDIQCDFLLFAERLLI